MLNGIRDSWLVIRGSWKENADRLQLTANLLSIQVNQRVSFFMSL